MDVINIVLFSQKCRFTCSNEKEPQIEMQIAHHLGVLQRGIQTGLFDENLMVNINDTHFVGNMDLRRTLGFKGGNIIKYVDV